MELTQAELNDVCKDWTRLVSLALGWSPEAAAEWARGHIHFAESEFFLHETTSYYVLPLIITDEVRQNSRRLGELESKLDLALERFRQKPPAEVGSERIAEIRREIREIIEANRLSQP